MCTSSVEDILAGVGISVSGGRFVGEDEGHDESFVLMHKLFANQHAAEGVCANLAVNVLDRCRQQQIKGVAVASNSIAGIVLCKLITVYLKKANFFATPIFDEKSHVGLPVVVADLALRGDDSLPGFLRKMKSYKQDVCMVVSVCNTPGFTAVDLGVPYLYSALTASSEATVH